jgi:predicted N-acetyltransferase YhbS
VQQKFHAGRVWVATDCHEIVVGCPPFYSKLGFRVLDETELTTGFQQLRLKELEVRLPISDSVSAALAGRVMMHYVL